MRTTQFHLGWSHYVFLMGIKDRDERHFYEMEAAEQSWSLRELKRQFESGLFERLALSRDKEGIRKLAREGQVISKPEDVLKEPYVLEFLGIEQRARYSNWARGSCSRRARSGSLSGKTISLSTWCSTTACCAATCS
jgi:hypothetical protein